jgi:hypothetical protein
MLIHIGNTDSEEGVVHDPSLETLVVLSCVFFS